MLTDFSPTFEHYCLVFAGSASFIYLCKPLCFVFFCTHILSNMFSMLIRSFLVALSGIHTFLTLLWWSVHLRTCRQPYTDLWSSYTALFSLVLCPVTSGLLDHPWIFNSLFNSWKMPWLAYPCTALTGIQNSLWVVWWDKQGITVRCGLWANVSRPLFLSIYIYTVQFLVV